MKVTICTSDGARVVIGRMEGVLDLLDEWENGDSAVMRFALDDVATTYIARAHIVRIDVDEPEGAE